MALCSSCEQEISDFPEPEPRITCKFCENIVHAKCAGMTVAVYMFFAQNSNYMWYCDNCVSAGEYNIDILKKVKQLENIIVEHTKKIEEQAKTIEMLKCKNVPLQTPVISNIVKSWADECSNTPVRSSAKRNPKRARFSNENENRKGEPVIIVKTTNESDVNKIEKQIKSSINPLNDPVKSLSVNKKGTVVVKCVDHDSVKQIQAKITNAVKDKFVCTVEKPKESKPVIKIVGISNYDNDKDELLSNIRAQNDLKDNDIEILFVREIRLSTNTYYTAYMKTDKGTFDKIMNTGRLNILWDRVKCYEHINVLRCFKCSMYGHIAEKCTADKYTCARCSGEHETNKCRSDVIKCPSCVCNNEKLKLNLPTDHPSWDKKCPSLVNQLDRMKKRLRYEQ